MGTLKKIAIGVTIPVIAGVILLFANSAWNEYALVGYQLHGPSSLSLDFESSFTVDLRKENDGNVEAAPISKIHVLNATIVKVSISGVGQHQLSRFCYFNESTAVISNLTIPKGRPLSVWATIHVVPNEEVASFVVWVEVQLQPDWLHPRSKVMRILPTELVYNRTGTNTFSLLE